MNQRSRRKAKEVPINYNDDLDLESQKLVNSKSKKRVTFSLNEIQPNI